MKTNGTPPPDKPPLAAALRACADGLYPAEAAAEIGYFFGDELSVAFYSPSVKEQLAAVGMKYGMFFEQDRYA